PNSTYTAGASRNSQPRGSLESFTPGLSHAAAGSVAATGRRPVPCARADELRCRSAGACPLRASVHTADGAAWVGEPRPYGRRATIAVRPPTDPIGFGCRRSTQGGKPLRYDGIRARNDGPPFNRYESGESPIATAERALIVNADEFGLTEHVNYGIVEAHQHGAVTSTTMLANMWAFDHAAGLARAHPTLAVGVHLNLTHGRPVLPPARVPTLVDQDGHFYRRSPFIRRLLRREVRIDEVIAECRAQIE